MQKLAATGEKIGEITIQNGKENKVTVAPVQDVVVSSRRDQKLEPKTQIIPGAQGTDQKRAVSRPTGRLFRRKEVQALICGFI